MSNNRKVAIFWDYENCSPPLNSQGHAIVNGIRRIAHVFGYVMSFKAYFDMSSQSSQKSIGFRSDLQSSGVSIIDCPHNGRKEVVDKMILVDMIAFAVDNPSPATVILIAGDRDYAYAISTLRLRQYNVVLIVPPAQNIPQSLESQASVVVDWNFAILGKRTEADISPVRQPYRNLDEDIVERLSREFCDSNEDPAVTLLSSNLPTSSAHTRRVSAAELLQPSVFEHNSDTASDNATQPASTLTPKKVASMIHETPVRPRFESVAKFPPPPPPPPAVTFNASSKNAPLPSSSHTRTISGGTSVPYVSKTQNAVPTAVPLSPVISSRGRNDGITAPNSTNIDLTSAMSPIAIDLLQHDKNVYLNAGVTRFAQYTALAESASLIQLGGREGDAWIALHPDLFSQDIDLDTPQSSSTPPTVHDNSPTPQDNIPYNMTSTPSSSSSATLPPSTESPGPTKPLKLNPKAEPFRAVVPIPLCFRPLIICLAKFRNDGVPKPVRSALGQELGPAAYSQAGTSSLKEYLAQALHAGVVECGGSGDSAWARLHPDVLNGKRSY
ncbi:NYN domain-containing protein [Suillus bovinus]|uniref:NYN domain-containing protein n=1 Tax=Suillus bovinus TaxID=48563 RepID=UPI001B85D0F1|nr:NYN domain-containing protein [Suillus bovinus]KAG2146931.1 NYN domain-containing protein [Suillus bovinus]